MFVEDPTADFRRMEFLIHEAEAVVTSWSLRIRKEKRLLKTHENAVFITIKAKPSLSADLRETARKITILARYSELTDKHSLPTVKELRVLRLFAVWSVWLSS